MSQPISLAERCRFSTTRLSVEDCGPLIASADTRRILAARLVEILSPEVTATLPEGWQDIGSAQRVLDWIDARFTESDVFAVTIAETGQLCGLLFLHASAVDTERRLSVRIGYLLARDYWGIGLGSELIRGLVQWCGNAGDVAAVAGVVDKDNVASARVLVNNGFEPALPGDGASMVSYERRFPIH